MAGIWPTAEQMLSEAPELEAKALFDTAGTQSTGLKDQHLRTFQRRVKLWRIQHGPDKKVFFSQDWEAGRAINWIGTNCNELAVTIEAAPYPHLLCHTVLPCSNWEWAARHIRSRCCRCGAGFKTVLPS